MFLFSKQKLQKSQGLTKVPFTYSGTISSASKLLHNASSCFYQMYEQVRKSLETCSIEKDIQYFVNQRKTGQTPPGDPGGVV